MEVVMLEDRPRQAAEYASRAGRLLIRLERWYFMIITLKADGIFKCICRYEEAIHVLTKEMSYHVAGENPAAMGRVLVAVVMVSAF